MRGVYKTVWEIKQKHLVEMAADRGAFIDQSQSFNVHIGDPNFGKLTSLHFTAWRMGLKTGMYYLRTRAAADAIKFTVRTQLLYASAHMQRMSVLVCCCLPLASQLLHCLEGSFGQELDSCEYHCLSHAGTHAGGPRGAESQIEEQPQRCVKRRQGERRGQPTGRRPQAEAVPLCTDPPRQLWHAAPRACSDNEPAGEHQAEHAKAKHGC